MKLFVAALALGMSGIAAAQGIQASSEDLSHGTLAVAAIQRGDWAHARRQLTRADTHDAARLINLGQVYLANGDVAEALGAWHAALAAPEQFQVTTMEGRTLTTDQLARELLAAHQPPRRSTLR